MYPHRIRLRGPWECEPLTRLGSAAEPPPPCRLTMPCRWQESALGDFAGRVRCRRRFGYPGRIDPHERVWLTFAAAEDRADIWLNGRLLGQHSGSEPFEFEVTALLQARNELVVEVESATSRGGLWGEVALEVRCTAFLRNVRVSRTANAEGAGLRVEGELVGTSERPLELYVLLDNRTVAYTTLDPAPAGRPFELVVEELPPMPQQRDRGTETAGAVRVELVDAAVVWYAMERRVGEA